MPRKILARDWTFELNGTEIKGITTFTSSQVKEDADTTDFDSAGNAEHIPAERSRTITVEGYYLESDVGARDPGQEAVETLAGNTGEGGLGTLTIESPAGTTKSAEVSVELGDVGGANNDPTSWGAIFTVSGKLE